MYNWDCAKTLVPVQIANIVFLVGTQNHQACLHADIIQDHRLLAFTVDSYVLNQSKWTQNLKRLTPRKSLQAFRCMLVYPFVLHSLVSGIKCIVDIFIFISFILWL